MKTLILLIALITAFHLLPSVGIPTELPTRPYIAEDYPSDQFKASATEIKHGNVKIKIRQAVKTENFEQSPYTCRAWFEVEKSGKTIFSKYYDDIFAVGFSYGLFVPLVQPNLPYLAVVKNGDYDGRLFLLRTDGKIYDLLGGFYFITKDKRYLFSEYTSDVSGLTVFDLVAGEVVFSSEKLPYIHRWYEKNGSYFFTESEWLDSSGWPTEKPETIHKFDFKSKKLIKKNVSPSYLKEAAVVDWDFDPRKFYNCTSPPNTPTEQPQ